MKKDLLTVLGCSSSLALTLLTGHSANANSLVASQKEYIFTAPQASVVEVIEVSLPEDNSTANLKELEDCGCSADFTDEEGEQAIAQFGCDCAGCRYIVRSRMQQDQLL
jgi:hypothetical protein